MYDLIATSTFGLESVVAEELKLLGYTDLTVENGKVSFTGRCARYCTLQCLAQDRGQVA